MNLIQFVLTILLVNLTTGTFIRANIKSIKCESDDSIYNGTLVCYIKPTRNGDGNTTAYYIFRKPANEFWFQLKLFYKFGTIYRQFMVDVDIDMCEFIRKNLKPPIVLDMIKNVLNNTFPNCIHPCPYYGEHGFRNINVNKLMGQLIPQVIPKGFYKAIARWHMHPRDNRSIITATIEVYIDAIDPLKSFDIG